MNESCACYLEGTCKTFEVTWLPVDHQVVVQIFEEGLNSEKESIKTIRHFSTRMGKHTSTYKITLAPLNLCGKKSCDPLPAEKAGGKNVVNVFKRFYTTNLEKIDRLHM